MIYSPPDIQPPAIAQPCITARPQADTSGASALVDDWACVEQRTIREVSVGDTVYRMRQPLQAVFFPEVAGEGQLYVDALSPAFVGRGYTYDLAYRDWRDRVHTAFQQLSGKRPFEMANDEKEKWALLQNAFDMVAYRNTTPVVVREVGEVSYEREQIPRAIRWIHGPKERVDLGLMPPEFAKLLPGQSFEAIVARDPRTGAMLRMKYARAVPTRHLLSREKLESFWNKLSGSNPESDADQRC